MAGSETTPSQANWGRWPAQQPAPEYVISGGLIEYDSRSISTTPLQRHPVTGPYLVNNSYSMAPVANLPAPHHHTSNPFGFDSYGPSSPESVASTFRQYQEPLPALRHSSGEDRRVQAPGYPSQERTQGYVERETHNSPQVKPEPRTLTPSPLTPNSAVELEVNSMPINVGDNGANKNSHSITGFITGVDSLMMAIQIKEEPRKNKPGANDRGASRYPSPPHSAHRPPAAKFGFVAAAEDKPYVCKIKRCGKRFPQKTHLETHKRKHTGEQPYRCPICSETFSQQGNLKVHHNRHKGIRPYGCDQCDKRFTQKANLTAHRDTHSGIKRFQCLLDGCGKRFGQRGNMKNHMNKFHGETVEALKAKYAEQRDHEMTTRELEVKSWFAHMFRHSNKGIKGRGKGRFVKPVTEHPENVVPGAVPSQRQDQQQLQLQQQRQAQPAVQYSLPMHSLPPPHTTIGHHHVSGGISGFPPCGVPRNDDGHHQGNGSVISRGPHHGSYGMYEMDHSGLESHSPSTCSSTNGSALDDDRHRGFGFQDRFHERLY